MAVSIEFLKSVPYFFGLNPKELEAISSLVTERDAERGEVILLDGEPTKALFLVGSGAVKVFKTSADGKEQILNIVRPGESFNDVPILSDGLNLASVQALGPVSFYKIGKREFEAILGKYPQVARNVIKVLADRIRHLLSLVEGLSFKNVTSRVAKVLLDHTSDGTSPVPRLTQQEMAAMAGTVREVVSRSLKTLEEEGVIRFERHRIAITDKEALEEMAASSS
ncbi:Crp/Fnr family transcriptional regulator [Chloroflexota bacterium]